MEGNFPFISRKDLAKRWNMSASTIDRIANNGEIKRAGYGKFRLSDVESYERRNSETTFKNVESFAERKLKQELIAEKNKNKKLTQKILQIAALAGAYMTDVAEEMNAAN